MRRNPDDDNPFYQAFAEEDPEEEILELEEDDLSLTRGFYEAQEAEARERQVFGEARRSPAQDLVREALAGGLKASQKEYARLGEALRQGGIDRSTRTIYREARRILEGAWGLDAVRVAPARGAKYARVRVPEQARATDAGPVFPRFAVHRFATRETLVPREGRRERLAPGQTYYGFDAISRAVEEYRSDMKNRIAEQTATIEKLTGGKGGPTVDRKMSRARRKRERLRAELKAFEEGVQRLSAPSSGSTSGPVPSKPVGKEEAVSEAQKMAAEGASRREVRQYLIDNNLTGRALSALVRQLFPRT